MYRMGLLQTVKSDYEKSSDSQECLTRVKMESFEALTMTTEEFAPSVPNMSYRYTCPSAGHFRCRDTQLVFWMWGEGSVEYHPEHWDERILTNSGYEPAGPLYCITSPETLMYRLDLPHCETDVYAAENLRVLHVSREQREFLQPQTVTHHHVSITIHGLSRFALVRKNKFSNQRVKGQVLFFLEPKVTANQNRLWVFLIPRSVPLLQVEESNKKYTYIKTSSNCIFRPKAKYTVESDIQHNFQVQPKKYTFLPDYSPSQHASFELFLSSGISELNLWILEKTKLKILRRWCRRLILKASSASENNVSSDGKHGLRWINTLCNIIEQLKKKEMKKLKGLMNSLETHDPIPKSSLEKAKDAVTLADLMVATWGTGDSILVTKELMGKLPRNDHAVTSLLNPFLVAA
ncbi:uncharacterized protein LOC134016693 isoform X2 [Osmerus eperlanus]|uniref:uncharacterized protein LOC134016693 isoform X2 n=1 Tax=Osmerus eperlanus TaxID=29151 RepID=UPI002E106A86